MTFKVEVCCATREKTKTGAVRKTAEFFLSKLRDKKIIKAGQEVILSIAIVGKKKIRRYNLRYRRKDEPTDVLSFLLEKNKKLLEGELLLCFEMIKKNAKDFGVSFKSELEKNIVHGILHLVGFSHGKKMWELQNKLISKQKS